MMDPLGETLQQFCDHCSDQGAAEECKRLKAENDRLEAEHKRDRDTIAQLQKWLEDGG